MMAVVRPSLKTLYLYVHTGSVSRFLGVRNASYSVISTLERQRPNTGLAASTALAGGVRTAQVCHQSLLHPSRVSGCPARSCSLRL